MDTMLIQALEEFLGLLRQLVTNLLGSDAELWGNELKKFLRKEPCWMIAKEIKNTWLKLISGRKKVTVAATDGVATLANADDVFYSIDGDFRGWGTDVVGAPTAKAPVKVYEMIKDGNFSQIYGGFGENLDRLCLSQAQIKAFCRDHRNWLRAGGYGTFFLFRVGAEFFVASVSVYPDGSLRADVRRLSHDHVWDAVYGHRFVIPQLTLEN